MNCFRVENDDIPYKNSPKTCSSKVQTVQEEWQTQRCYVVLYMGFHCAWYLASTIITPWNLCNLPLCVIPTFLVFFGSQNPLFSLVHYNSVHSALVLQAKENDRWW